MSTEFKWTDNLVAEFIQARLHIVDSASFDLIEQFKESKQLKPEWEILKIIGLNSNLTIDYNPEYHNNENWNIYSVKRLSDGEVFKLNDKVWPNLTIKSFYFPKEYEARYGECSLAVIFHEPNANYCFKDLKHCKPLFKTEDGIDIHIGDDYWYVSRMYNIYTDKCDHMTGSKVVANGHAGDKFFSSEEAAKGWVLFNKPLLSLNEIKNIGQTDSENIYFKRLINAAKNNLNK